MANQTDIDTYLNTTKPSVASNINTIVSAINASPNNGDCLAYYNNKDQMYYFVKVHAKTVVAQDVSLTVRGVRFKLSTPIHVPVSYFFNSASGMCTNGKSTILQSTSPYGVIGTSISYVEFFNGVSLNISTLLHNATMNMNDDVEEIIVLPGSYPYNNCANPTPLTPITGVNNYLPTSQYFLMWGAARQLAYNFIYNV